MTGPLTGPRVRPAWVARTGGSRPQPGGCSVLKATLHGGDLVAKVLKTEGVTCVFGLSGGHVSTIFDGLLTEGIRLIDTRHEEAAVMMAEGWARYTGRPGVAVVTAGPGVVNSFPGVAIAYQTRAPVVVIGGRASIARRDLGAMQDVDQVEIMRPVTKWARTVLRTERIPDYLGTAFRQATSGRPGPVFLDIPEDVCGGWIAAESLSPRIHSATIQETSAGKAELPESPEDHRSTGRPGADWEEVRRAAKLVAEAKRPVIVAGSGVWWSGACEDLVAFAERTGVPVYTRTMARGAVPDDHPLGAGFFPAGLMQADLVLILGTRYDWTIGFGRPPLFGPDLKVIQVDIEPEEIGRNRRADVGLPADVKVVLRQLGWALEQLGNPKADPAWAATLKEMRESFKRMLGAGTGAGTGAGESGRQTGAEVTNGGGPIHPALLVQEVRARLPREAAIILDGGDIAGFAMTTMDAYGPGSCTWVGGFGHLGVGIPYAVAAKLAQPERPVAVITGDGSFGLGAMEFDTAVRHGVPIVCVIGNDTAWGQVRHGQEATFGPDRTPGTGLGWRSYEKVVTALGGYGERVDRLDQVGPALKRAFAYGLPACINVPTDPSAVFRGMTAMWPIT